MGAEVSYRNVVPIFKSLLYQVTEDWHLYKHSSVEPQVSNMLLFNRLLQEGRKGKGKGRFMGLFNTAAVRPSVFLPPTSSRIHLQRRHASYKCARSLPAKAGTITYEFC